MHSLFGILGGHDDLNLIKFPIYLHTKGRQIMRYVSHHKMTTVWPFVAQFSYRPVSYNKKSVTVEISI